MEVVKLLRLYQPVHEHKSLKVFAGTHSHRVQVHLTENAVYELYVTIRFQTTYAILLITL
jgi:hypothetical protein